MVSALGVQEYSYTANDLEEITIDEDNFNLDIVRILNIANSGHSFETLPCKNRRVSIIVDGVGRISGRPVNKFFSDIMGAEVFGDVVIMMCDAEGDFVDLVTSSKPLSYWQEDNCAQLRNLIHKYMCG